MLERICKYKMPDKSFGYVHSKDTPPRQQDFILHNHREYEILIFLKGNAEFIVEGNVYELSPMDIIITRPDEMHYILLTNSKVYERIVFHIDASFFENVEYKKYLEIFLNRKSGEGNLIKKETAKSAEVFDTIVRLENYMREEEKDNSLVIRCVMTELLHQLNNMKFSDGRVQNQTVKNVINYINEHLGEDLSLDLLANEFFVSKHHLCRSFKICTGFTVNRYITYRRIMLTKELHRNGKSLSEASSEAGFSDYSNFYRAYVKETGYSPTAGMGGTNMKSMLDKI